MAEAKISSHRSDIHADPRAMHDIADDKKQDNNNYTKHKIDKGGKGLLDDASKERSNIRERRRRRQPKSVKGFLPEHTDPEAANFKSM
jgi:hypothetical protein